MTTTIETARSSTAGRKPDPIRDGLLRQYLDELLSQFESLAISAREAVWRENDTLASIHIDQLRLVGREVVSSFKELHGSKK
ncbi:hypothetical protein [Methylocystis echinoides]|uniref:Uncharacterized protein n=1 Tax=Methylocystis echinoides TaxID=29468 RepID=A0A9W6GU89_9HYPH|nr:hypothetical protein [Methylocystis echinoides]GLI92989.1 hypothetical protein LMG27198_19810 [Methylocystis echinoides]